MPDNKIKYINIHNNYNNHNNNDDDNNDDDDDKGKFNLHDKITDCLV